MSKKRIRSVLSVCLCALLLCCGAGGAMSALAAEGDKAQEPAAREETASSEESRETHPAGDTVYVISGADGAVNKVIGGEEKDLPVQVNVRYQLDGKTVSPEELAGKSGRVTIRFDYENTQRETVEIDGKPQTVTVPITMISGLVLDDSRFSNVTVNSGKVLNDGSRTMVVGLAIPGLKDNLALQTEKLEKAELPELDDYVEVTADVKDFSLSMTLTVAATDLFSDLDQLDSLEDLGDLQSSLDQLTDAMEQLMNGSGQLAEGLETLQQKTGDLTDGVDRLATGAAALNSGAEQLDSGISSLQDGTARVAAGLNTLSANSADLDQGAAQVFNALLSTANQQIAAAGLDAPVLTIDNYADVLGGIIASVDDTVYTAALEQVTAAVETHRPEITAKVTAAVEEEVNRQVATAVRSEVEGKVADAVWQAALPQVTEQVTAAVRRQVTGQVTAAVEENVTAQVLAGAGLDSDAYAALVAAGTDGPVTQAIRAQMTGSDVQSLIQSQVESQMSSQDVQDLLAAQIQAQKGADAVQSAIAQQTDAQMATAQVQGVIQSATDEKMASDEVKALIDKNVETQVQLAVSQAMAGEEVQSKMTAAKEKAQPLIALKASLDSYNAFYLGLQSYTAGVDQLAQGAGALKSGADQLKTGSTQLAAGSGQLQSGLTQLQGSMPALTDGVARLRDGAGDLRDGLQKFDREGVQKLVDAVDGDVVGLLNRLKAVKEAANLYHARYGEDYKVLYRTGAVEQ